MKRPGLGTAQVIRADARDLPLADNSVDLVVTSPPYFALRSYQDGGEHYAGQIGSEPTPAEFVAALLDVTRECVRVLKPSGSLWINLGDKYAAGHGGSSTEGKGVNINVGRDDLPNAPASWGKRDATGRAIVPGFRPKTLMGMPWRYALACIDELGLILRAEVIWSKPNGLPESVTDRVRRSHEQWFHFVTQPRYFSAVDEIREELSQTPGAQSWRRIREPGHGTYAPGDRNDTHTIGGHVPNPLGKLPGSVWTIPTEPLRVPDHLGIDHFAAFPTEWPRRIVSGWSPAGVCVECGEGRRPVTLKRVEPDAQGRLGRHGGTRADAPLAGPARTMLNGLSVRTVTGYACACPEPTAPTTPAVVLDPFGGTGTTALVAKALGRHGISVDMSADYCRLAAWRTNDRDQLANVLGLARAGPPDEAQVTLF